MKNPTCIVNVCKIDVQVRVINDLKERQRAEREQKIREREAANEKFFFFFFFYYYYYYYL
jgi:hypothetical protein